MPGGARRPRRRIASEPSHEHGPRRPIDRTIRCVREPEVASSHSRRARRQEPHGGRFRTTRDRISVRRDDEGGSGRGAGRNDPTLLSDRCDHRTHLTGAGSCRARAERGGRVRSWGGRLAPVRWDLPRGGTRSAAGVLSTEPTAAGPPASVSRGPGRRGGGRRSLRGDETPPRRVALASEEVAIETVVRPRTAPSRGGDAAATIVRIRRGCHAWGEPRSGRSRPSSPVRRSRRRWPGGCAGERSRAFAPSTIETGSSKGRAARWAGAAAREPPRSPSPTEADPVTTAAVARRRRSVANRVVSSGSITPPISGALRRRSPATRRCREAIERRSIAALARSAFGGPAGGGKRVERLAGPARDHGASGPSKPPCAEVADLLRRTVAVARGTARPSGSFRKRRVPFATPGRCRVPSRRARNATSRARSRYSEGFGDRVRVGVRSARGSFGEATACSPSASPRCRRPAGGRKAGTPRQGLGRPKAGHGTGTAAGGLGRVHPAPYRATLDPDHVGALEVRPRARDSVGGLESPACALSRPVAESRTGSCLGRVASDHRSSRRSRE